MTSSPREFLDDGGDGTDVALYPPDKAQDYLEAKVAAGSFRTSLLHHLAAHELRIPPLRERREDIACLLVQFLREELADIGESHRLSFPAGDAGPWLPASVVARLAAHDWPGDVRQLRDVVRQIVRDNRERDRVEITPAVERLLVRSPAQARNLDPELTARSSSVLDLMHLSARELDLPAMAASTPLGSGRREPAEATEAKIDYAALTRIWRPTDFSLRSSWVVENARRAALAIPASTAPTLAAADAPSRLLIVLLSLRARRPKAGAKWSVRTGERAVELDAATTWSNRDEEALVFSAGMNPGLCTLHHAGSPARDLAVHLYPGWTTQVIIDQVASGTHFETMRVFLVPRNEILPPEFAIAQAIERGLTLLASRAGDPPAPLARVMAGEYFDDPMLGLLAAHLVSSGCRRWPSGRGSKTRAPGRGILLPQPATRRYPPAAAHARAPRRRRAWRGNGAARRLTGPWCSPRAARRHSTPRGTPRPGWATTGKGSARRAQTA